MGTNRENHEISGNMFQLPKAQVGPYNPYFEVQMHQLQSNKSREPQEALPDNVVK